MKAQAPDAVFAAGGDGTVSLVAQALAATDLPLGILPLGSGNGLAKDLSIPLDLEEALQLIWRHQVRSLDTLRVGGQFAVHLADMGFNAQVVRAFNAGGVRGPAAYVRVATQEYATYQPTTYRIETDRETWEGAAFMLTIANANTFGSNVVINPDSQLDDGQFENLPDRTLSQFGRAGPALPPLHQRLRRIGLHPPPALPPRPHPRGRSGGGTRAAGRRIGPAAHPRRRRNPAAQPVGAGAGRYCRRGVSFAADADMGGSGGSTGGLWSRSRNTSGWPPGSRVRSQV